MRTVAVIFAVLVAAAPASAQEPYYAPPPGPPPAICAGNAFVDIVGTPAADALRAFSRATRVWGLGGNDRLDGSTTRASCLLGGRGNDKLLLNAGGGVAHGNRGRDVIFGSGLGDVINPGRGSDGVIAGGGDDKVTVRDGNPEIVDCGPGGDQVRADRRDLLIGCEASSFAGRAAPRLSPRPARANNGDTVRFTLRPPRTGTYRVLYLPACKPEPVVVKAFDRLRGRRSVRIAVQPPGQGWCRGKARLAIVRDPGQALPAVPVARLAFTVL